MGIVYKLWVKINNIEHCYIGSTTNLLSQRASIHKYHYDKGLKNSTSRFLYELAKNEKLKVNREILLEDCDDYQFYEHYYIHEYKRLENVHLVNKKL